MTVLLLDPRWPTQIPMDGVVALRAPITYTGEVPISVRWHVSDLAGQEELGTGTLVSTNREDPEVLERVERGERVIEAPSREDPLEEARRVMSRALDLGEWEARQTHESLLPYLREETEEFCEAVSAGASSEELRKELGDLFLQVLFHAEIADRRGEFDLGDVARSFVEKMRVRSPYLFDGTVIPVSEEEQERLWAEGKNSEKGH